ncbi:MAG: glycosyltransferase [Candidatus Aureabacteria bacterium]|nr:glycosyltransferase [Candidatus Auribacterota bacterium]
MKQETVSIIIPVKNAGGYLEEQLTAIGAQEGALRTEIILIDSGSTDGTLRIAARHPARVISIRPEEFNHGGTRNLGAQEAKGAYLVFLTQDATPAGGAWLANLLKPLREDAAVAGAFSRHIPRPGCSLPLMRQIEEEWSQCGGMERVVKRVSSREELERQKPFYVYYANTSSCMRREIWKRFPFRETEFGEDVDWAERVLLAGYAVVYEPASAVLHSHDYPLREQIRQHYDYGRMVRAAALAPAITVRRSIMTVIDSLRQDMRYAKKKRPPCTRLLYSLPFHISCAAGRWMGEHSARLPRAVQRFCSRQTQIKSKTCHAAGKSETCPPEAGPKSQNTNLRAQSPTPQS